MYIYKAATYKMQLGKRPVYLYVLMHHALDSIVYIDMRNHAFELHRESKL